ncbi:flagellar motor switch protein FliM [Actinosynnema pretiosum]|uniref:Flagellar motor switch protein FliM n=1 Tax=Actinosynnema pretiosum TaxID=42197 RepID=A0A290Z4F6_9PSEU|nr:flagellar motor switch protein FliM [Actinosynnema pretiosum]
MTQSPLLTSSSGGASRSPGLVANPGDPEVFDFTRPVKLPRELLRVLQLCYETFAHRLGTLLTSTLRVVCHAELISIEQLSYAEHMAELANPTLLAPVVLEPLPGTALLEMTLSTAMTSMDHMLGGKGGPQPARPLSDIETPLLRDLLDQALEQLRVGMESVADVRPELEGLEYNPQLVQTSTPTDAVVVGYFELNVGEEQGQVSLCIPLQTILPSLRSYRDKVAVSASERATREAARNAITAGLQNVPVAVSVKFQSVRLEPADLVDLQPGDVIPLTHRLDEPLDIVAAGRTFANAVATKRGTRLACLVVAGADSEENKR